MRLIDKDALKVKAEHIIGINGSSDAWHILSEIDHAEEIDAEPVRHRHWIPKFGGEFKGGAYWYDCSECGYTVAGGILSGNNFCKNCGAKMDER